MRTVICVECGKAFETNACHVKFCPECRPLMNKLSHKRANDRYRAKPSTKKKVADRARSRRRENDKDPAKREERLRKRREQDYRAGRSHPKKPPLTEEQKRLKRRIRSSIWSAAHADEKKSYMRRWREANRERIRKHNREKFASLSEENKQKKRDHHNAWQSGYRARGRADFEAGKITQASVAFIKSRDREEQWARDNPERYNELKSMSKRRQYEKLCYGRVASAWLSMGVLE